MTSLLRCLKTALAQSFSLCLLSLTLAILGCGGGSMASAPMAGSHLSGNVHGGQQPVSSAIVTLYAAGANGNAAGATALVTSSTDVNGSFSLTGRYTCPSASSQLYIVATGGNPRLAAGTNNTSLALMAALGPCGLYDGQYTLDPSSFTNIDEVTTVAAVYALTGFLDPAATQVGAGGNNSTGMANALRAALNLVDNTTGQARTSTPAGNGAIPQATINTLADILTPCVNSAGNGPDCAALFAAATPSGGTAPTNTLQAMFNIAAHPAQQVATLFALCPPTPPFQPTLSAAPNDWTLEVNYTASGLIHPTAVAVDASGNIWIAISGISTVIELSNTGAVLSTGVAPGSMTFTSTATDSSGNVWSVSTANNLVTQLIGAATPVVSP